MTFSGKVVIVTGASSGIGATTAVMFCKEGASVALVDRNEAQLKTTSEKCTTAGGKHIVIKADIANDDEAKTIVDNTIKKFGKIDVLANIAGIVAYGTILEGTILKSYDDIMKINLRGVVHLTMLSAPHLVKTKGTIINISSIAGKAVVNPIFMAYCISKSGVTHFTRMAALELAHAGVRVNSISPGPVETNLIANAGAKPDSFDDKTPLGRVSQPEEIGDLILYLTGDKSRGITGSDFVTDNGYMLK